MLNPKVLEVFLYFLKLGCTGFGGPVALVAIMQKEIVEEKQWVDPEQFLKVLPLIKAMPGAFSFQVAAYIGVQRAGRWGGFFAGLGLVLPAFFMMIGLSKLLEVYGSIEWLQRWIEGFQWAAIALMIGALKGLTQGYHKNILFWTLTAAAAVSQYFHLSSEVLLILGMGLMSWTYLSRARRTQALLLAALPAVSSQVVLPSLSHLFWVCFSSGAFVFGTGVAIAPLLENEFVLKAGWITHGEFMTALALGQMTPGPVLVIVTMIGYKVFGFLGAALATFAVYSPGWIHMLTWFPKFSQKLIGMKSIQNFLLGALAAVVGAILITIVNLIRQGSHQEVGIVLVALLLFISLKWKWSSWKIVLLGGVTYSVLVMLLRL